MSQLPFVSVFMHAFLQERYFLPSRNIVGKRKCHSYGILTPADKENAQKLGVRGRGLCSELPACVRNLVIGLFLLCFVKREQLTEVILRLLGAWTDPLSRLYWSMSQGQNKDFNLPSSDKALEMSEMVRELREGVAKVAEKVNRNLLYKENVSCVPSLVRSIFNLELSMICCLR